MRTVKSRTSSGMGSQGVLSALGVAVWLCAATGATHAQGQAQDEKAPPPTTTPAPTAPASGTVPPAPTSPSPEAAPEAPAVEPAPPAAEPASPAQDPTADVVVPVDEAGAEVIEVIDQSNRAAAAQRLRQSAAAVTVVDTARAQQRAVDLGEVLARTEGVGVRRSGGLGSETRFSLQGLTDDQIRFFLDGLPLELAGFPFGISNVPVNLVERVEVYSGVVPVRLGADALGGAVNLISGGSPGDSGVALSHELGSFETQRLSASGRAVYAPWRAYARASAFLDTTDGSYPVQVEVADAEGQLQAATVRRFHDAYLSYGGSVELGALPRSWADRLSLRAWATRYEKELQHNVTMKVPYGEASYHETAAGLSATYAYAPVPALALEANAGGSASRGRFLDVSECVYDWYGRCVRARTIAGETDRLPHDQLYWELAAFARLHGEWRASEQQRVRLSLAPSYVWRTGDERRQPEGSMRDLLEGERSLATFVVGVEHELDALDDDLENLAFAKAYVQRFLEDAPSLAGGTERTTGSQTRLGLGDSLRYRVQPWLLAKASYEWATRLPRPDEIFGDGVFIGGNLSLRPEKSHNLNLSVLYEPSANRDPATRWSGRAAVTGFLRLVDDLVVAGIGDRVQSSQNVSSARSLGVEASGTAAVPGEWLALDASLTYLDLRNVSSEGTFGAFDGDRVPNRPYFFAAAAARLQWKGLATERDSLSLSWDVRYVHEFFRGWESIGRGGDKQTIDAQLVHGAGLVYATKHQRYGLTVALDLQNLTDEATYDFFGVQRPGRAYFVKTTAEL